MRLDEKNQKCPATLGEYRDICLAIGGPTCRAVEFLNRQIAIEGTDSEVMVPDSQMRVVLMPMLVEGIVENAAMQIKVIGEQSIESLKKTGTAIQESSVAMQELKAAMASARAAEVVTVTHTAVGDYDVRIDGVWVDNFSVLNEHDGANAKAEAIRAVFVREIQRARRAALIEAADFAVAVKDEYEKEMLSVVEEQPTKALKDELADVITLTTEQMQEIANGLRELGEVQK